MQFIPNLGVGLLRGIDIADKHSPQPSAPTPAVSNRACEAMLAWLLPALCNGKVGEVRTTPGF